MVLGSDLGLDIKVLEDGKERVATVEVEVLVVPAISTILWSVDKALDAYNFATIYDNEPFPRVAFNKTLMHKLTKKQHCRWMEASVWIQDSTGPQRRTKAAGSAGTCIISGWGAAGLRTSLGSPPV